jgi:Tfp pilus assembly protein PilF
LFCYTNIKYADSLIKYSEEALVIFPNHSIFHHLNGIGYYNKKDYSSAQASFNRALEVEVTDNKALQAEIYSLLADTYYHTKDYKLSDTHFDKAIALDPQNPVIKNNYAYYLSERNQRLDFAKELSEQSLKISPDEASFLDTYGWILYQLGDYKKAETYVIKAIEKSGEDVSSTLLEHLGDIHFKLNKLSDAIKYWEMALEKDPDNNSLKEKLKTKAVK